MKATIVKLPARYAILVGEGVEEQVLFGNTGYQSAEKAKALGATEIVMGDHQCNLTFTHTLPLVQPSSSGSSSKARKKKSSR